MTPEGLVAAAAARWDDSGGALTSEALDALARRQAGAGKVCGACGEKKRLGAYGRDSRERDGLRRTCRACISARDAATYRRRIPS